MAPFQLRLDIVGDNFRHYEGQNASVVRQQHQEASWFTFYPWRQRVFRLELYKESCVGIETPSGYKVALRTRCKYWRLFSHLFILLLSHLPSYY